MTFFLLNQTAPVFPPIGVFNVLKLPRIILYKMIALLLLNVCAIKGCLQTVS